jgi:hypothetical protein
MMWPLLSRSEAQSRVAVQMKRWIIFLAMAPILWPLPSAAEEQSFVNGELLYQWCTASEEHVESSASCNAYILGVFDGNKFAGRSGYDEFQFCITGELTVEQLGEIVSGHLKKFPETKETPASALILAALYNEYPCKR